VLKIPPIANLQNVIGQLNLKDMIKLFIQIIVISVTIVSCNESKAPTPEKREPMNNGGEIKETPNYSFMSNSQVEQLIKSNSPIFLSFWIGMAEEDSYEVIRYLIEQGKISGVIYSSEERDFESLSSENIKDPEFKDNARNIYCYLTPKSETIKCEFDLNFDGQKSLESIFVTVTENVDLQVFNDFVDLYKTKFGNPTYKRNKPLSDIFPSGETYRRYSFERGNKLIDIEYNSEHKGIGGGFSPSQIHIYYEHKDIKKIESDKFLEQMKIENERIEEKKVNTLNDI
jgi:hypothetical protein